MRRYVKPRILEVQAVFMVSIRIRYNSHNSKFCSTNRNFTLGAKPIMLGSKVSSSLVIGTT